MITQRFWDVDPVPYSPFGGRYTARTRRCRSARRTEAAASLAGESCLPLVEDAAWSWRQKAYFLAFLLVIASLNWILAQEATAFFKAFNGLVSRGSESDALASSNMQVPTLPLNWQFP